MPQISVRIDDELDAELRQEADEVGLRPSDLVRLALRAYLQHRSPVASAADRYERVRHLIGSVDSGLTDLGERHSEYMVEALRRGR